MNDLDSIEAFDLYKKGRFAEALPKLLELERQGSLEAKLCLGYMYQEGMGVGKDYDEALTRYRTLSEAGAPIGSSYAGALLEQLGRIKESIDYRILAANAGDISSSYALYRLGKDHPEFLNEGDRQKYFKTALDGGHLYAQRDMAHLMIRGKYGLFGVLRSIPLFISVMFNMMKLTANDPKNPKLYG